MIPLKFTWTCGWLVWFTATTCNSQCPEYPQVNTLQHHFNLTKVNQTITMRCDRSCGNYTETWMLLLYSTNRSRLVHPELISENNDNFFEDQFRDFSVQRLPGESGCTAGTAMVTFSLEMTLINDNINSTRGNIIIACGVQASDGTKIFADLSSVVYLPTPHAAACSTPTCPPSPSATLTSPSLSGHLNRSFSCTPPTATTTPSTCITANDNPLGLIIANWPTSSGLFLSGMLTGVIVACFITYCCCVKTK